MSQGWILVCSHGASTNMPHSPYTMLGIAASNSTMNENDVIIHFFMNSGASSARKIATPKLRGSAKINPSREETTVPQIMGRAPNCSATGSHVDDVMNPKPNFAMERREFETNW